MTAKNEYLYLMNTEGSKYATAYPPSRHILRPSRWPLTIV